MLTYLQYESVMIQHIFKYQIIYTKYAISKFYNYW